MPNPKEVRDLIRQTHASIRTHQAAGVVSGVLEMYGPHEGFHVAVGSVDFTPLHWVASARKAASAMIAKIPEPLSRHIARVYRP